MHFRTLDRAQLVHENGVRAQRLLPWPALDVPFEGSWCVVDPHSASTPHAHREHEIFIAVAGEAVVEADGERRPFAAGDIAFFEPGVTHSVHNEGERPFEMYSVWWDDDMGARFAGRDRAGRRS